MDRHKNGNTVIRIAPDVYEELSHLVAMTRRSISEIATEALRYALDNSRMVEVRAYDVRFGVCVKGVQTNENRNGD